MPLQICLSSEAERTERRNGDHLTGCLHINCENSRVRGEGLKCILVFYKNTSGSGRESARATETFRRGHWEKSGRQRKRKKPLRFLDLHGYFSMWFFLFFLLKYSPVTVGKWVPQLWSCKYPDLLGNQAILKAPIGQLRSGEKSGGQATWSGGAVGGGLPIGYSNPAPVLESLYSWALPCSPTGMS